MAKELDDAEYWLPSEFLCDEIFLGGGNRGREGKAGLGGAYFSGELPLGTDANLDDSPVESVTETEESDEEDYLAGLTQQMARYFLQDDEKDASAAAAAEAANNAKVKNPFSCCQRLILERQLALHPLIGGGFLKTMAGSPQSTLCAWSSASNKGSPNGPSLVSSPPSSSPLQQQRITDPCDLLREAAGQVMRFRTTNDLGRHQGLNDIGLLSVPNKPTPVVTSVSKNAAAGYYAPNHITTQQQLQAAHVRPDLRSVALRLAAPSKTPSPTFAAAAAATASWIRHESRVSAHHGLAKRVRRNRCLPSPHCRQQAGAKEEDW
ncbi:hypothetical protein B296_00058994 [Ensete ventricosum]|uniref:Uncharacterized protein n=1 Tax=Ensete ventricosum TaxID=4639 RepID=A0A426X7G9_ENSVE|nr:hypothetical protein B296_00058994 [Ensete ventricosum]